MGWSITNKRPTRLRQASQGQIFKIRTWYVNLQLISKIVNFNDPVLLGRKMWKLDIAFQRENEETDILCFEDTNNLEQIFKERKIVTNNITHYLENVLRCNVRGIYNLQAIFVAPIVLYTYTTSFFRIAIKSLHFGFLRRWEILKQFVRMRRWHCWCDELPVIIQNLMWPVSTSK